MSVIVVAVWQVLPRNMSSVVFCTKLSKKLKYNKVAKKNLFDFLDKSFSFDIKFWVLIGLNWQGNLIYWNPIKLLITHCVLGQNNIIFQPHNVFCIFTTNYKNGLTRATIYELILFFPLKQLAMKPVWYINYKYYNNSLYATLRA